MIKKGQKTPKIRQKWQKTGSCTIFVEILAQTRDRLGVKKKGQWPWNSLKNTTSSYWVCLI
ncbi:MAG: hypothetical protein AB7T27_06200, partial [Kiritimatiellia bacterium]